MIKSVHLIVCSEHLKTLNHSLHKAAVAVCEAAGLHVHITDIYELYHKNHPAVLPYGIDISDSEHDDIVAEQENMKNSQLIVFQFPLYWFSVPGLLKNYLDRVWEKGVAFLDEPDIKPLLTDKQVLFSMTMNAKESDINAHSPLGTLEQLLFPLKKSCEFVGLDVKTPFVCFGAHTKTPHEIEGTIEGYRSHLETLIGKSEIVVAK